MAQFETLEPGVIALIQQQEDGRIVQLGITQEQSDMLQILLAKMSETSPFIRMGEAHDLVLKSSFENKKVTKRSKGQICSKCGEKTILMSGTVYGDADSEPYESGVIEEVENHSCEVYLSFLFCADCNKAEEGSFIEQ